MNEAEWLVSIDPMAMLKYIDGDDLDISDRKVLLLTVACLHRLEKHIPQSCLAWASVAELVAEGHADRKRLGDSHKAADTELDRLIHDHENPQVRGAALAVSDVFGVSWRWPWVWGFPWTGMEEVYAAWQNQREQQAALVRDIVGNPFREVEVRQSWLKRSDRIVPKLAQAIYAEYAFDRLPILADALEEAGCTDADILNHFRQPGEHVRGCWVVDLLLGKS